jgi:hypothetical protein
MNIKEYKYNWNVDDNWWKLNKIKCALCSTDIRYEYFLQNINDENDIIKVWCECVKKFEWIPSTILNKDRNKCLKDKKKLNVLSILSQLVHLNTTFGYSKVIEYYENRDWFTPKQILVIYKDIIRYMIDSNYNDFKVKLLRDREKKQISELWLKDKEILLKFLTPQQKQKFNLF